MKKPKVRGYRVYLIAPEIPETKIQISEETKESLLKERLELFRKLKVYAVGESISDIKEGDEVMVDVRALPSMLANGSVVKLDNNISVIIVNANDICHIW